ncbi:hypothetical protein NAP1_00075 [Erythrobacter sp. NAP1]|nr:hypothetical protein NAP1_00075 [Erythrobacter sp. NAP1]
MVTTTAAATNAPSAGKVWRTRDFEGFAGVMVVQAPSFIGMCASWSDAHEYDRNLWRSGAFKSTP